MEEDEKGNRHVEIVLYHVFFQYHHRRRLKHATVSHCHMHASRLKLDVIGGKESDFASGDSFPPAGVDLFDFRDDFPRVKGQLIVVVCLVVVERDRG